MEENKIEEVVEQPTPVIEQPVVQPQPVVENTTNELPVGNNPIPPKKKGKKGLIITIIILILLIAGGITTWLIMSNNSSDSNEPDTEEKDNKKDKDKEKDKDDDEEKEKKLIDFYCQSDHTWCSLEPKDGYELYHQYECKNDDCFVVSLLLYKNERFVIHDGDSYIYDFDTKTKEKINISFEDQSYVTVVDDLYLYYSEGSTSKYAVYNIKTGKQIADFKYAVVGDYFTFDDKIYIDVREYAPASGTYLELETGSIPEGDLSSVLNFVYWYYYFIAKSDSMYINANIDYVKANGYVANSIGSNSQTPKAFGVISATKTDNGYDIKYAYIDENSNEDTKDCIKKYSISGNYYGYCSEVVNSLYKEGKADHIYTLHLIWDNDKYVISDITFEK